MKAKLVAFACVLLIGVGSAGSVAATASAHPNPCPIRGY